MSPLRVFLSPSAADRLAVARDALRTCAPGSRVLIVGASRGAADDLARDVAAAIPATFGIQRLSLTQAAARTALLALAAGQTTPSTWLGAEAVAARAAFDAGRASALRYFAPVADTPGFPRALARTLQELRLAGLGSAVLAPLPLAGPDLAWLLDRFEASFAETSSVDRAGLFRAAAAVLREAANPSAGPPRAPVAPLGGPRPTYDFVVLLDVPIDDTVEREFVHALVDEAGAALATVPRGDRDTLDRLASTGGTVEEHAPAGSTDLDRLRRFLFVTEEEPPRHEQFDGSVHFFSAPGEGRESVEIARRILAEARRDVRFDEMAVLVRSPQQYFGLLEHALRRAGVPAWFDRGTRRPHPAGRAFLALLACAAEQLSASRFAEYLSLGQVPQIVVDGEWVASQDETFGLPDEARVPDEDAEEAEPPDPGSRVPDPGVIAGTLRAPWRWEKLLIEAAVIGQDATRWQRRLAGKAAELERQIAEAEDEHGADSGRVQARRLTRQQLEHLRRFALPIVEELAAWPRTATWGAWLDAFTRLVPRVLRTPAQVLRVLADLRPMADIGPIDLDEARRVLSERLLTLETEPPARRFGRVFVGTPQQARGRSFRVVFVPGLAERMFPQKPLEDPLLLDELRTAADRSLRTQPHRLAGERLLLHLAAGAAAERLYVSYPRIELTEARARVPSFYALDVMRAATGRVPDYEWLEERAREAGNATLAWPAPPRPEDAIDDLEHDLAVLRRLLDDKDRDAVKGHAHYLLKLNECLRRSVIDRWARGESRWSVNDGLIRVVDDTREILASERLAARPYSLSALQRFSACPYQFLLAAVYRLQPLEQPEPLQRMDPLTRGSLFHEMQARFLRRLHDQGRLPVTAATIERARGVLDDVVDLVAARAYDELVPAVNRVWTDEIAFIRRDLHGWLQFLARDGEEWQPRYFEFAFGSVPGERDAGSVRDEVTLDGGFRLRGAVDLIEEHRTSDTLRVTDHKTGRRPDRIEKVIVGGGAVLQPVLYGMAIEAALGRPVSVGRLFYCTAAGSYYEHPIPITERTRAAGLEVLQVIDRAIASGFLAAAPTEDACARCDFRPVCGPDVFRRTSRKPQDRLADLLALRSRP
ncbi:MAG: PD-(D/E)XK nuclease family protein [Acidobacteria bacterium]|nr:PD-(D/E)XK nuclease family protein [Acidobacteriota bacterium]